jgi:hypothetical protein
MEYSLKDLKDMAYKANLTHGPNISAVTLEEKLKEHIADKNVSLEELYEMVKSETLLSVPSDKESPLESILEPSTVKLSSKVNSAEVERLSNLTFATVDNDRLKQDEKTRLRDAMKLVRCIITSNNKNKSSYTGDIFCARNKVLPEVKKFVPFGVPTHVPQILFNMIKEKQLQVFRKERLSNGNMVTKPMLVAEYNIQVLPPLTKDELEAIKKKQLAEGFNGE